MDQNCAATVHAPFDSAIIPETAIRQHGRSTFLTVRVAGNSPATSLELKVIGRQMMTGKRVCAMCATLRSAVSCSGRCARSAPCTEAAVAVTDVLAEFDAGECAGVSTAGRTSRSSMSARSSRPRSMKGTCSREQWNNRQPKAWGRWIGVGGYRQASYRVPAAIGVVKVGQGDAFRELFGPPGLRSNGHSQQGWPLSTCRRHPERHRQRLHVVVGLSHLGDPFDRLGSWTETRLGGTRQHGFEVLAILPKGVYAFSAFPEEGLQV